MSVKDLSAREYVQHGDLGQRLNLKEFPDLKAAAGCMHFTEGWLHLPTWFPITDDGITCKKLFAYYKDEKYEDVYVPIKQLRAENHSFELEGVCAIGGDNNYWHFMMERLPQLFFLDDPEIADRQFAHSYTKTNLEFCRHILELLGIKNKTFVEIPMDKPYAGYSKGPQFMPFKDVIIPSKIPRPLATMLWDNFLWPQADRPKPRGRRLFIVRETKGRRQLLNQDEVAKELEAEGFETVDPGTLPIKEQMQLFAESEFVIGVHGAALTNFLFVPPSCRVVELANGIKQSFYGDLSKGRGLDYKIVMGMPDGFDGHNMDFFIEHHMDFTLELDKIRQLI